MVEKKKPFDFSNFKLGEATGEVTSEGRLVYHNSEGGKSTELSITVSDPGLNGGRPTIIPSIFGGRILSQREAINKIIEAGGRDPETGRILDSFDSFESADKFAKLRSRKIQIVPLEEFGR